MDIAQKRNQILEGPLWKIIVVLGLPVMLTNLFQTFYNLINMYFVGKLGTMEQAAMQFVWPLTFLIMSFGAGFSIAAISLISQEVGNNDMKAANRYAGQSILFSVLVAVLVSLVFYILTPWIVRTMGAKEPQLIASSITFFRTSLFGTVGMFLMFTFGSIRNALGDTMLPMRLNIFSLILNILLSPLLIFYFHLGIAGVALATVISRNLFGILSVLILFSKRMDHPLSKEDLKIQKNPFLTMLKVGFPSSLGQSVEAFGFVILNIFIYRLGKETLTAFAIGNQINGLILMPAMGMGAAVSTIVGQNLGAGKVERARKGVLTCLFMGVGFLSLAGLPMIFFARPIIQVFTSDPVVIAQGTDYLILITLSIPLMASFQSFVSTFQGSGHTGLSMLMQMSRLWVFRIPMIMLFLHFPQLGAYAVWNAMVLSNLFTSIMGYFMYRSPIWEKPVI